MEKRHADLFGPDSTVPKERWTALIMLDLKYHATHSQETSYGTLRQAIHEFTFEPDTTWIDLLQNSTEKLLYLFIDAIEDTTVKEANVKLIESIIRNNVSKISRDSFLTYGGQPHSIIRLLLSPHPRLQNLGWHIVLSDPELRSERLEHLQKWIAHEAERKSIWKAGDRGVSGRWEFIEGVVHIQILKRLLLELPSSQAKDTLLKYLPELSASGELIDPLLKETEWAVHLIWELLNERAN